MTTPTQSPQQSNAQASNPLAPKEMKELKRVYDQLCYFADKSHALQRLKEIKVALGEHQQSVTSSMRRRGLSALTDNERGGGGGGEGEEGGGSERSSNCSINDQDNKIIADLQKEQSELKKKLTDIRNRPVQHIRPQDTASALKALDFRLHH